MTAAIVRQDGGMVLLRIIGPRGDIERVLTCRQAYQLAERLARIANNIEKIGGAS